VARRHLGEVKAGSQVWNDGRMPGEVAPRDDRAWPPGSLVVSAVLAVVAAAGGVAATVGAADHGAAAAAWVTTGLVVAAGYGLFVSLRLMRRWMAGRPVSGRDLVLLWAGFGAAFLALAGFEGLLGGAVFAGLLAGVFVANVCAIRLARRNRALVDLAEAEQALGYEASRRTGVPISRVATAPVGQVLRDAVSGEQQRAAAWLVAGVLVAAAGAALGLPGEITLVVGAAAGCGFVWVLRRLWAGRRALRDVGSAAVPRRAFVIVLHDPEPRIVRPLLGIWPEPPLARGGRVPEPHRVYRCDERHIDLACHKGAVVAYEAWVATGPRRWSTPRWVAADDGVALPHRPALLGRWYLSRLLSGERPGVPQPLTVPAPHQAQEPAIQTEGRAGGGFAAALARRLALLAAFAAFLFLVG
jgi:hypothetical protein